MHNNILSIILIIICNLILSGCMPFIIGTAIVGATTSIIVSDRGVITFNDDNELRQKIYLRLEKEEKLQQANITITSFNQEILLTGQVPTTMLKVTVEKIIAEFAIKRIYNELTVGKSVHSDTNDTWITTKVKSALIAKKTINSNNIKVVTENSVVYLMGKVPEDVAKLAIRTTQEISGVKKVVNTFQYYVAFDPT